MFLMTMSQSTRTVDVVRQLRKFLDLEVPGLWRDGVLQKVSDDDLSLVDGQIDVVHGPHRAEVLAEVTEMDRGWRSAIQLRARSPS